LKEEARGIIANFLILLDFEYFTHLYVIDWLILEDESR